MQAGMVKTGPELFPWEPSTARGQRWRPGPCSLRGQEGGKHIRRATWAAAPAEGAGDRDGRDLAQWARLEAGLFTGRVAHAHTCRRRQLL